MLFDHIDANKKRMVNMVVKTCLSLDAFTSQFGTTRKLIRRSPLIQKCWEEHVIPALPRLMKAIFILASYRFSCTCNVNFFPLHLFSTCTHAGVSLGNSKVSHVDEAETRQIATTVWTWYHASWRSGFWFRRLQIMRNVELWKGIVNPWSGHA